MMSASVSFIIPYFNSGTTIQETIESIYHQDYPHFDIWLIDDGSTDPGSIEKLKDLECKPEIHVLRQQNAGPGVARNAAIRASSAEFIVPLDADDKIAKNGLTLLMEAIAHNSKTGVAYGAIQYFGENNYLRIQKAFDWRKQLLWNQVAMCCLIRKEVFDNAGFFDESLSKPGLEDWEFWMRVSEAGWAFTHIPDVTFFVRVLSTSRTYAVANKNLDSIKQHVYSKHSLRLAEAYEALYYEHKMTLETPDYRLGHFLLKPYRILKTLFQ